MKRKIFSSALLLVLLISVWFGWIWNLRITPFENIRFTCKKIEVFHDGSWQELERINGLGVADLVERSEFVFGRSWAKRIAEDLPRSLLVSGRPIIQTRFKLKTRQTSSAEIVGTHEKRDQIRHTWSLVKDHDCQTDAPFVLAPVEAGSRRQVEVFQKFLDEFAKRNWLGVLGMYHRGKVLFARQVTVEGESNANMDAKYRVASVSKQFTAAATLLLVDRGQFKLDQSTCTWLKSFCVDPYDRITIKHLLNHTSGLPRIAQDQGVWQDMSEKPTGLQEYVDLAVQQPLLFEPGSDFAYSNFGYRLLSKVIEVAVGETFGEFMRKEVFHPLGMKDSGVARVSGDQEEIVIGYEYIDSRWQPSESRRNYGTGYGSGGIYTSPADLIKWHQGLYPDRLLSAKALSVLEMSWSVRKSLNGDWWFSSGSNSQYSAKLWRNAAEDSIVFWLANVRDSDSSDELLFEMDRMIRGFNFQAN